ncbi:acyltransferase family protein [Gorillibacterium timonense]|uniref:acyltransferase family protein n=1 Tax=Gorillibacterium timonense TaxID=1689269 RepID=UPI00071E3959|nr:acyltransferase [Gorillibacterium timonense]
MKTRLEELDSLRGIAAISVILAHISIILPASNIFEKINYTPLHIFWLGHESVILFFVLSGFVLSLPFFKKSQLGYKDYLIRRICRILIPSVVSVILALSLMKIISPAGIPGLSRWFNDIWTEPLFMQSIVNHFFVLGEFNTMRLNPVIWSLIHELRISILFPFLMLLVLKTGWKKNLALVLSIPLLYFLSYYVCLKVFSYDLTIFRGGYSSYSLTPHYMAFFLLGALLARYKDHIRIIYNKLNLLLRSILFVFGFVSYLYVWLILPNNNMLHIFIMNDWMIALGCVVFIVFGLNSRVMSRILLFKPIHFVGKISYSIYLYHMIVILTLTYALNHVVPIEISLTISFVVTFVVATLMYYLVELPAIKLGKRLTKKNEAKQPHLQAEF